MDLTEAVLLTKQKLIEHGLSTWKVGLNSRRNTFGLCSYATKTIILSIPLVEMNSKALVLDTILHEIAHALTPHEKHNSVWKAKALELGAKPERCFSVASVSMPQAKYTLACPACAHTMGVNRKLKRRYSCAKCSPGVFNSKFEMKEK